MRTMKKNIFALVVMSLIVFVAGTVRADWNPDDDHKMHWPQMPDSNGLDVNFTFTKVLADDWKCSQTGPVSDIHFWMSTKDDRDPSTLMAGIHASIHLDVPDPDGSGTGYSHPGTRVWHRDFVPTQYSVKLWGTGVQGFYDPNTDQLAEVPHNKIWQVNITGITDYFIQQKDQIYWLDLSVLDVSGGIDPTQPVLGWKTTFKTKDNPGGGWNDDAVWGHLTTDPGHNLTAAAGWQELIDPRDQVSLDLAFVITPEPATMIILALGGLAMLLGRRSS